MTITIDTQSGFCPGVQKAIKKAEEHLQKGERLTALGSLIHNPRELARLATSGLLTRSQDVLNDSQALRQLDGETVLVRTHGLSLKEFQLLQQSGADVLDATCSVVRRVQQKIIKEAGDGRQIVIIGKQGHAEVLGLAGQAANSIIVQDEKELDQAALLERVAIFCQTTFHHDRFKYLAELVRLRVTDCVIHDTTCRFIGRRFEQVQEFARSVNVVLVVAGPDSSNAKILYESCKAVNDRSYRVETIAEIECKWFRQDDRVGITGSASTPLWQLQDLQDHLFELSAQWGQ
jgi:4-hydroxy-3-methylbut-2-en-1-yl diphosphate reductase